MSSTNKDTETDDLAATVEDLHLSDAARQQAFWDSLKNALSGSKVDHEENAVFPGLRTNQDIEHWGLFGRRGHRQPIRATKHSWSNVEDWDREPVTEPWGLEVSPQNLLALLHGFVPVEMEDKLVVYAEGPVVVSETEAEASVNFQSGWRGYKHASIALDIDFSSGVWQGTIKEITYVPAGDMSVDDAGEFARFFVLEACNWVLVVRLLGNRPIKQPQWWRKLGEQKADLKIIEVTKTTYKGTSISQETFEDLMRLGSKPIKLS